MEGRIGEEGENEGGKEGGRVWERRVLDPREGWKRRQLKAKGGCDATTNEILRKKREGRKKGERDRRRGLGGDGKKQKEDLEERPEYKIQQR